MSRQVQFITDENGRRAVVLDASEYERLLREIESLKETLHLLRSPANRQRLIKAVEDVDKGMIDEHGLIEN